MLYADAIRVAVKNYDFIQEKRVKFRVIRSSSLYQLVLENT